MSDPSSGSRRTTNSNESNDGSNENSNSSNDDNSNSSSSSSSNNQQRTSTSLRGRSARGRRRRIVRTTVTRRTIRSRSGQNSSSTTQTPANTSAPLTATTTNRNRTTTSNNNNLGSQQAGPVSPVTGSRTPTPTRLRIGVANRQIATKSTATNRRGRRGNVIRRGTSFRPVGVVRRGTIPMSYGNGRPSTPNPQISGPNRNGTSGSGPNGSRGPLGGSGPNSGGRSNRGTGPNGGGGPGASSDEFDNLCAICRSDITDMAITNCNHRFCADCIAEWTQTHATCPSCRGNIHTIRHIMSDGSVETIEISRAEILGRKINETHSMLMLLFSVIAHSLLPEVNGVITELDTIASDMNIPTTNSRARAAAAARANGGSPSDSDSGTGSSNDDSEEHIDQDDDSNDEFFNRRRTVTTNPFRRATDGIVRGGLVRGGIARGGIVRGAGLGPRPATSSINRPNSVSPRNIMFGASMGANRTSVGPVGGTDPVAVPPHLLPTALLENLVGRGIPANRPSAPSNIAASGNNTTGISPLNNNNPAFTRINQTPVSSGGSILATSIANRVGATPPSLQSSLLLNNFNQHFAQSQTPPTSGIGSRLDNTPARFNTGLPTAITTTSTGSSSGGSTLAPTTTTASSGSSSGVSSITPITNSITGSDQSFPAVKSAVSSQSNNGNRHTTPLAPMQSNQLNQQRARRLEMASSSPSNSRSRSTSPNQGIRWIHGNPSTGSSNNENVPPSNSSGSSATGSQSGRSTPNRSGNAFFGLGQQRQRQQQQRQQHALTMDPQRESDIRSLSESYRKINQVFEILQILHILVHRNSVEMDSIPE